MSYTPVPISAVGAGNAVASPGKFFGAKFGKYGRNLGKFRLNLAKIWTNLGVIWQK